MSSTTTHTNNSGTHAVYAAVEAATTTSHLQPIPSYELYKVAREEELAALRALCRVLAMRHGAGPLPKTYSRMMEDLQEEMAIPRERVELEMHTAAHDTVLASIAASGILKRRAEFFDGVDDITLEEADQRAAEDGFAVCVPQHKSARVEAHGSSAAMASNNNVSGVGRGAPAGRNRRTIPAAFQATVRKLGKEVSEYTRALLYATSPQITAEMEQKLAQHRDTLRRMKEEAAEYVQ